MNNLLTPKQTAARLAVSERTLAQWRWKGTGPAYVKMGRALVRYPESELQKWIDLRIVPTYTQEQEGSHDAPKPERIQRTPTARAGHHRLGRHKTRKA